MLNRFIVSHVQLVTMVLLLMALLPHSGLHSPNVYELMNEHAIHKYSYSNITQIYYCYIGQPTMLTLGDNFDMHIVYRRADAFT